MVELPSLVVGDRLVLMTKATAVLNKWLSRPGARFCHCIEVHGDRLTVVVEFPAPDIKTDGEVLGVDVGIHKLLSTSQGEFLDTGFKDVMAKIRRRKPGSKSRARARHERDQAVNEALNKLPWDEVRAVAFEDLRGIKHGKKRSSKSFRRSRSSWVASKVATRLKHKAAEHGVQDVSVNPSWSSQNHAACGKRGARQGAVFYCKSCDVVTDADFNAAVNIQKRGETALAKNQITKLVQAAGIVLQARTGNAPVSGPKGSRKRSSRKTAPTTVSSERVEASGDLRSDGRRTAPATTRRERKGQPTDVGVKDPERARTPGSPRRVGSLGRGRLKKAADEAS